MVQTTSIDLRGDRYAARALSLAHTNRLLGIFRNLNSFQNLQTNSHRENFYDATGNFIGSITMSTCYGVETVIVDVPVITPEKEKERVVEKQEAINISDVTLLMPLFEEDYYFAGHEDTAFKDFLEYGRLVMDTKFSDPYLWLAENPPIFWGEREVPEVYYPSDSIITEQRRAGENSYAVRDKYNDMYYTGGDPHFEVDGASEVLGDKKGLSDCFMFLWYEESNFDPYPGEYVNLRYGVNINGEEIVLYEGTNSYYGSSVQCCEIYDFNGTPVYIFAVGFKDGTFVNPGAANIIYGCSLNGTVTTKQYAAEGVTNYRHQISQELHRTDGWAHGRLRVAKIEKQIIVK